MKITVDIVLILIIIMNIAVGYRKGLIRAMFGILSTVIAIVIVFFVYKPLTNYIYNNTEIGKNIEQRLTEEVLKNSSNTIVTYATTQISYNILGGIVYFMLFTAIRLILAILNKYLNLLANLPFLRIVNKSGGMIYGVIKGVLVVYVIFAIISLFTPVIGGNNSFLTAINDSYIGSKMFNNNIILNLIFKFL